MVSETRSEPDRGGRFGAVYVITGVQAAGKSTVAQALAERLPRSAHISGDTFRRFMVGGRVEMSPDPSPEALRQLRLRYRLAARSADEYAGAGFTAIVQDVILGPELSYLIDRIHTRPLYVVVLAPRPEVVAQRESARTKTAYGPYTIADLDTILREDTPHLGLWLDSSDLTVDETVDRILAARPLHR
ncbi:AAA family ATPase [Nocardia terpenica]|uniref:Phosphotransferase n=1 Tax=Nocardia terpenica TaxID=455432 RepID=A0A291RE99_9NOCA|nr:AAA family ATPase [Nocardia terpenica]ATL65422.1 phosphotransferase [Nocardia terpenica]